MRRVEQGLKNFYSKEDRKEGKDEKRKGGNENEGSVKKKGKRNRVKEKVSEIIEKMQNKSE